MITHSEDRDERWETTRALWRPFFFAALPITLAGGLGVWIGIHSLRQSSNEGGWAFLGIGAIFATIGLAYVVILIVGCVKLWRGDFDGPGGMQGSPQPWQAREDWARGEVRSESRNEFVTALVAAIFGSAVAAIALAAMWPRTETIRGMDWLVLLFPLGALFVIGRCVFLGRRWLKYGDAQLQLKAVPLRPGDVLDGIVQIPRRIHPQGGFNLRLACVKKVTVGSGKRKRTREETLWQAEQVVSGDALESALRSVQFPVAFQIPKAMPPTSQHDRTSIIWRLHVRARMPGLDYATDFVLPVFAAAPVAN